MRFWLGALASFALLFGGAIAGIVTRVIVAGKASAMAGIALPMALVASFCFSIVVGLVWAAGRGLAGKGLQSERSMAWTHLPVPPLVAGAVGLFDGAISSDASALGLGGPFFVLGVLYGSALFGLGLAGLYPPPRSTR